MVMLRLDRIIIAILISGEWLIILKKVVIEKRYDMQGELQLSGEVLAFFVYVAMNVMALDSLLKL